MQKTSQDETSPRHDAFWALEHLTKPTIAAITSAALGAGAELARACDVRIADESAIFSHPEVDLGWMPSHGATARLSKIVGRSRALEILVSGKEVKALDALRLGIVNHLASPGGAFDQAKALATAFASKPRSAVKAIKRALTEGDEKPYATASSWSRSTRSSSFGRTSTKRRWSGSARNAAEFSKVSAAQPCRKIVSFDPQRFNSMSTPTSVATNDPFLRRVAFKILRRSSSLAKASSDRKNPKSISTRAFTRTAPTSREPLSRTGPTIDVRRPRTRFRKPKQTTRPSAHSPARTFAYESRGSRP